MPSNAIHRANLAAAIAIGITGTGFLLFRAQALSFTHDEALTYLHAIRPGIGRLFAFGYPNANNHLLNSALSWCSYRMFGNAEWALRLPNVLAFGVFVFAAYRLMSRRLRPSLVVPGLLLIVCNPFQLDFFALCRGYGLALAFTLLALEFSVSSLEDPSRRTLASRKANSVSAGVCAALATLSNLAWLNFTLALAFVVGTIQFVRTRRDPTAGSFFRDWVLPQLATAITLIAVLLPVVTKLRAEQALYFGGDTGFWSDTVGSLIESTLYAQPYTLSALGPLAVGVAVALVTATGIVLAGAARVVPGSSRETALALLGILIACAVSSQLQHQLMGTKFLVDRTALFLVPVFALLMIFSCDALDGHPSLRRAGNIAAGVFAALAALHTALALNTSHTLTWAYDSDTKRMLNDLGAFVAEGPAPPHPLSLGAEWLHQPAVDFYRERDGLDWLAPMTRSDFERAHDFYFYLQDSTDPEIERIPMQPLQQYPQSGHVLARDQRGFE
ncbi:MAG: hypothetical protein JRG90_11040 [Deltaproteobacteria bacterium]|nr:hypothetical protein [Deltaproteobacteria bacterium]MBW2665897.1 hypothetical protein [Deltaproteobacteria bacterium]